MRIGFYATLFLGFCTATLSLRAEQVKAVFHQGADGKLVYVADVKGNVVPDFSGAGYLGGGVALPTVPANIRVSSSGQDDTARIQAAIDWVSRLPLDEFGIRGAVELAAGEFKVFGQLKISASGVTLRGSTLEDSPTVLIAAGEGRRDLIRVGGAAKPVLEGLERSLSSDYVPVGSHLIEISDTNGIVVGDSVRIVRPGSQEWMVALGMDKSPARSPYNWKGEKIVLHWDRRVVGISGGRLQLDAPITTALDTEYGRSFVQRFESTSAISQVGVESLVCVSEYRSENLKDENHSWVAVSVNGAVDSWVSDISAKRFALSSVWVGEDSRRVTVQDCSFLDPVSEMGGYRRQSFNTYGQQTLFLRCYSEHAIDDFTVGHLAGGPNVFLECRTLLSKGTSGSIGHWASGMLFDNVHINGGGLALDNREVWNQGVGWAAANSVIYESSAGDIVSRRPPTANNWAINVWGQFHGDGTWIGTSEFANPKSLYIAQLRDRLGAAAGAALAKRVYISNRMAVPELEQVLPELPVNELVEGDPMRVVNGQLQAGGLPLIGRDANTTWWRGRLLPTRAADFGYGITRYTPGRTGPGLTDDLEDMTDAMVEAGDLALRHHYGLWYDRRRDDHEMSRRSSGDVWPPFFEQPFNRSGEGDAWHGLSKYDLFDYNAWYFERLAEFAELAQQKRLVLINEMFFQHNIIESGAHWVDNPWRPENTIQNTEFTEPPPFSGDTIKMADEFYDVSHPVRRAVNKAYIRKCLDNLSDEPNVIHVIGAEYTGPLHFMQFWLDTVGEWMEETGKDPVIGLSCTKDVQDAILADPIRSALIDVIDFQYWWYSDDGVFEPKGGISLAPRQNVRKGGTGKFSAKSLARMVSEYRERFPDKAVITTKAISDPWLYTIAGGSFAPLPRTTDEALLKVIAGSKPIAIGSDSLWALKDEQGSYVIRSDNDGRFDVTMLDSKREYELLSIDLNTGETKSLGRFKANSKTLAKELTRLPLFWLSGI